MTTNQILEIVNNLRTIDQSLFAIYLTWYLWDRRKPYSHPESILIHDPKRLALCLGIALLVDKYGASIVGITIWILRTYGLGGGVAPPPAASIPGMVGGSLLMTIGAILLLRLMSIGRFGERVWLGLVAIDVIFLAWTFGRLLLP